jgi:ribonuclease HII
MGEALFAFDQRWREKGFFILAGVDEAGRGPWAGPVAAAAVVLRPDTRWPELNDSKKLSPATRNHLFNEIRAHALFSAVRLVPAETVDERNILQATFLAMRQALRALGVDPSLILVDGNTRIPEIPARLQETIVGGDGLSASIAAASVLAKVARDRWMIEAHRHYPHYDFENNKGYGTPAHAEALRRHGPSPVHRKSFAPVRETLSPSLPFERVSDPV